MEYLFLGILGFLVGYSTELAALNRRRGLKPAVWIVSFGLLISAMVMVSLHSNRVFFPHWLTLAGWAFLPVTSLMMLYTLVLELPFRRTFMGSPSGTDLVTTGTYALVRHPTVLWYVLILLSALLATRSLALLVAMPIWIAMDVVWVLFQERSSLARSFPQYSNYAEVTPFLIPNRRSLTNFCNSFRHSRTVSPESLGR